MIKILLAENAYFFKLNCLTEKGHHPLISISNHFCKIGARVLTCNDLIVFKVRGFDFCLAFKLVALKFVMLKH